MTTDPQWCPHEDEAGKRCQLGPDHTATHHFGPFKPADAQWAMLENVAKVVGVRNLQCVGTSQVATLKALNRRGFLRIRYVNSRTWDAQLTRAGRHLLDNRPR